MVSQEEITFSEDACFLYRTNFYITYPLECKIWPVFLKRKVDIKEWNKENNIVHWLLCTYFCFQPCSDCKSHKQILEKSHCYIWKQNKEVFPLQCFQIKFKSNRAFLYWHYEFYFQSWVPKELWTSHSSLPSIKL